MRAEGAGEVEEAAAPEAAAAREVRRATAQVRARHRPDLVGEAPAAVAVEAEGRTEDLEDRRKQIKKKPRLGLFFLRVRSGTKSRKFESNRFGGFAFYFKGFFGVGIVEDGDFVAVLIAALVDDLEHFGRGFGGQRKCLNAHVIAFGAHGDLGDGRVEHGSFELGRLRTFMRLDGVDDDWNSFFGDGHGNGSRNLGAGSSGSERRKAGGERAAKQSGL